MTISIGDEKFENVLVHWWHVQAISGNPHCTAPPFAWHHRIEFTVSGEQTCRQIKMIEPNNDPHDP